MHLIVVLKKLAAQACVQVLAFLRRDHLYERSFERADQLARGSSSAGLAGRCFKKASKKFTTLLQKEDYHLNS